jgi:hypothetical protein
LSQADENSFLSVEELVEQDDGDDWFNEVEETEITAISERNCNSSWQDMPSK